MRITWAEIDLTAITHNLKKIREKVGNARIVAIVKANAYGHGIIRVAETAVNAGVDYLGVGFLEEGLLLRRRGFTIPILVLGGVLFHQVHRFIDNELEITVSSLDLAYAINAAAEKLGSKAKIHLKFDTGMNRIGMHFSKAVQVFERLKPLRHLEIIGIYSHFSTADEQDHRYTHLQFQRFKAILRDAEHIGIHPIYRHIACSGAIHQHPDTFFNMVRVGLAMYGLYPSNSSIHDMDLHPVMTFKSKVVFLKTVKAGEPVSYGRTYYTTDDVTIATIPVGYGDGYNRLLSNRGHVLIHGKRHRIIGSVCMDQIMVEIQSDTKVRIGDEVVLYGRQQHGEIPVEEVAQLIGTIPYEVTCWLARRVPRVFITSSPETR